MREPQINPEIKDTLISYLESTSRIIGLDLCFYTYAYRQMIPGYWQIHAHPVCMKVKEKHIKECVVHCGNGIPDRILAQEPGVVDKCPFGCTQIIAPVFYGDTLGGVLFAGVFKEEGDKNANAGLRAFRSKEWVATRRNIVKILALGISAVMVSESKTQKNNMRLEIMRFIMENLFYSIRLKDLAKYIKKSQSRTSHLVKEHFGCSFQHLLADMRINRAMSMLSQSNLSVLEISNELGFADQSHFTRTFKARTLLTPLAYRKKHSLV